MKWQVVSILHARKKYFQFFTALKLQAVVFFNFLAIFEYSDEHGKGRKVLFCVTVLATARPWFLKPAACGCAQAGGTHLQLPHFCFGRP